MSQGSLVFALTGGIGSGKSTVASIWRDMGLPVIDADALARQAVQVGSDGLKAITTRFGDAVLLDDGSLNRAKLAALVFEDPRARESLNAIVHPLVKKAASSAFRRAATDGHELICYEVPLLFETGQEEQFRPVVVVTLPEPAQVARTMARDGLSEEEVRARMDAQAELHLKAAQADYVIDNSGPLDETTRQAERVLAQIRAAHAAQ